MSTWLRTIGSRCWAMLRRDRLDREFDEELTTHLELLVDEACRRGLSPADARHEARRKLGRPAALREAHREQQGMPRLEALGQDIRHAFRLFSRTPIVTATALLTIALGVGGSTAVFSVVYAVMLRPLPYPAPDRLVELFEDNPRANTADVPRLGAQLSLVGGTRDEHGSARGVRRAPVSPSPTMASRSACPAARSPRRCSACSACRRSPAAAFAPKTSGRGLHASR